MKFQYHKLSRCFILLFLLGLALRIFLSPQYRGVDTFAFRTWTHYAYQEGPTRLYGPTDRELSEGEISLERYNRLMWNMAEYLNFDYPPASTYYFYLIGFIDHFFDPEVKKSRGLAFLLNSFGTIASMLTCVLIFFFFYGQGRSKVGEMAALSFWLNPALILSSPLLGYQDPVFIFIEALCVYLYFNKRAGLCFLLYPLAPLLKPQGILLFPILLVASLMDYPLKRQIRFFGLMALCVTAVYLPFILDGRFLSSVLGPLTVFEDLLSASFNAWQIFSGIVLIVDDGIRGLADRNIYNLFFEISKFKEFFGINPWTISIPLVLLGTYLNIKLFVGRYRDSKEVFFYCAILEIYLFTQVAVSSLENHLCQVLVFLPFLFCERRYIVFFWVLSLFLFFNVFLLNSHYLAPLPYPCLLFVLFSILNGIVFIIFSNRAFHLFKTSTE